MSIYAVNLVARDAIRDLDFRELLKRGPEIALEPYALTEPERTALLAGDVAALYELGAHEYLLMALGRCEVLGLDIPTFSERIRRAEYRPNY